MILSSALHAHESHGCHRSERETGDRVGLLKEQGFYPASYPEKPGFIRKALIVGCL
jgi:hypothetical protein